MAAYEEDDWGYGTTQGVETPQWGSQSTLVDVNTYRDDVVTESRLHVQYGHPLNDVAELFEVAVSSQAHATALLDIAGEDAKVVLDALQLWLDSIPSDTDMYRAGVYCLIKLASKSGVLPPSLFIRGVDLGENREPEDFGGFADVFRATYKGMEVALKRLRMRAKDDVRLHQRFCREALVWRQLRHPSILRFLGIDVNAFRSSIFISMVSPWMHRGRLKDYISSSAYIPKLHRDKLLSQVSKGLVYLHSLGIVHGDIHASNVLIDEAGNAQLTDFGLVVVGPAAIGQLTTTEITAGAARWMSPERLDPRTAGNRLTMACDVWSFGCLIFLMHTHCQPFAHITVNRHVQVAVLNGERPHRPSQAECYHTPPTDSMWEIAEKCWAWKGADRPSMQEVDTLLECEISTSSKPSLDTEGTKTGTDDETQSSSRTSSFSNLTAMTTSSSHSIPTPIFGMDITPTSDKESIGTYDSDFFKYPSLSPKLALLSHLAILLRDNIPRRKIVKNKFPYPHAFTGEDIVSTIQVQIQRKLLLLHGISTSDRRVALQIARSMQSQLFFCEVEWSDRPLRDSVEDVFMFLDDTKDTSDTYADDQLPTGVVPILATCYSPICTEGGSCYAIICPKHGDPDILEYSPLDSELEEREDWEMSVNQTLLMSMSDNEYRRQVAIHKIIDIQHSYNQDLNAISSLFIHGLRRGLPLSEAPIMPLEKLDGFIDDVFHNVLDLRECHLRLMESLSTLQQEQGPIIHEIGDVFLATASEFSLMYPAYVGHLPLSEKRLEEEITANPSFRVFLEHCERQPQMRQLTLKALLSRPSEYLQELPVLLGAILTATAEGNLDGISLREAIHAIQNLQPNVQLVKFQVAMGIGPTAKMQWFDMAGKEVYMKVGKKETRRQSIIFELILNEMTFVRDLESIDLLYIQPLRIAKPPIIPQRQLVTFIANVFHNYTQLLACHRRLLNKLHRIQQEQHPILDSVTSALKDTFLDLEWRDAYREYISNYPIAVYWITEELSHNEAFKVFHTEAIRHPKAFRMEMQSFVHRPVPRLQRYSLMMGYILETTPLGHVDQSEIPQLRDMINVLSKDFESGMKSSEMRVKLWGINKLLVFKAGETIDLGLLDRDRRLICTGEFLHHSDVGLVRSVWNELFCLLADNYLIITKPFEKDGTTKYLVYYQPIPSSRLAFANFADLPIQRNTSVFRSLRRKYGKSGDMTTAPQEVLNDADVLYPCTIHYTGYPGGSITLYAKSAAQREEWMIQLRESFDNCQVV